MATRVCMAAALVLSLLGCEDRSTAPGGGQSLEFRSAVAQYGPAEATAVGESHAVSFRGRFPVSGGGYELRAEIGRNTPEGVDLELRILATRTAPGIAIPLSHEYSAVITGVPVGDTRVRVVHVETSRARSEDVAFDGDVEVAEITVQ